MVQTSSLAPIKSVIAKNYQIVEERIARACQRVRRSRDEISLVVVSKGHSIERIQAAIELGLSKFGENYAEEGIEKIKALSFYTGIEWHMIGHIQSRKAEMVIQNYSMIHSLDSLKLALRLQRYAEASNKKMPVLIECNVSGEETKFGFSASERTFWDQLLSDLAEIARLPNLEVRGLMTMAPFFENSEDARPVFRQLVELQRFLQAQLPEVRWHELSMGMSSDFEIAIEEGATIVRIGQAILGERPHP